QPGEQVEHTQQPHHRRHAQAAERAGDVARVDLALLDVHRTAAVVDDVDGDVAAHRAVPGRRPRRAGGRGQGENGIIGRWLHRLAVTAWLWRRGPGRPPQVSRPEAR